MFSSSFLGSDCGSMSWITSDDIPIASARAIISPCLLSSHNTSWTYRPPASVQYQLLVGTTGSWWIHFRAVDIYCIEAILMWVGLLTALPQWDALFLSIAGLQLFFSSLNHELAKSFGPSSADATFGSLADGGHKGGALWRRVIC